MIFEDGSKFISALFSISSNTGFAVTWAAVGLVTPARVSLSNASFAGALMALML